MPKLMSLANQLLLANPTNPNPALSHSVIYVCEHHLQGTVGLIINQPTQYSLDLVFKQLHIDALTDQIRRKPLLFGGPMQPERGFVIHRPFGHWKSSLSLLTDDVTITTSNDIIRAIAEDKGPPDALVVLGFVGWNQDELENEIMHDDWIVCPFKPDLLYNERYEKRWEAAGLSMGINMNQLILGSGHA